jgi:acetyl-CoA carboxylase biotin carboxylase subunit
MFKKNNCKWGIALRVVLVKWALKLLPSILHFDGRKFACKFADEAVCIGAPQATVLFENVKYCTAAEITNADSIHPGYRFLSENSKFSKICQNTELNSLELLEMIDRMGISICKSHYD